MIIQFIYCYSYNICLFHKNQSIISLTLSCISLWVQMRSSDYREAWCFNAHFEWGIQKFVILCTFLKVTLEVISRTPRHLKEIVKSSTTSHLLCSISPKFTDKKFWNLTSLQFILWAWHNCGFFISKSRCHPIYETHWWQDINEFLSSLPQCGFFSSIIIRLYKSKRLLF